MAEQILRQAKEKNISDAKKNAVVMRERMPTQAAKAILRYVDIRTRTRLERVCREWRTMVAPINAADTRTVWIHIIFRHKHYTQHGHEKCAITVSSDGPIFWSKLVVYCYCCSCHFMSHHEPVLIGMMNRLGARVQRVCLVDSPVDYPFIPDAFFFYMAQKLPTLQYLYIREIDMEHINGATVVALADHPTLKKVIVHQCRNYDAMTDFGQLPQLLVVNGEIQGLKMFLGDLDMSMYTNTSSRAQSSAGRMKNGKGTNCGVHVSMNCPDSTGDSQATDEAGTMSPLSECIDLPRDDGAIDGIVNGVNGTLINNGVGSSATS